MSRRWLFSSGLAGWTIRLTFIVCLAIATLALAPRGSANATLKVDEANVKVLLALEPAQVLLPIENNSGSLTQTLIHLELVDPADQIVTQVDQQQEVGTSKTISIKLDSFVSKLKEKERSLLPWLRLRYRLSDQSSPIVLCEGILALSPVAPELFQVRVSASYLAREGSDYQVRVQTINSATNTPVAHVGIVGRVVLQSDPRDVVLEAFGNTDAFGYATLSYKIPTRFPPFPHSLRPAGGELHVIGQRGVLTASYGMLLAEIGLPPGADVDRASLETAMRSSEWSINQYDVLPDRIVVYLWPRAGGSEFSFKFCPPFCNVRESGSLFFV